MEYEYEGAESGNTRVNYLKTEPKYRINVLGYFPHASAPVRDPATSLHSGDPFSGSMFAADVSSVKPALWWTATHRQRHYWKWKQSQ